MSIEKNELYQLIDILPEKEISIAKRFLEFIIAQSHFEDQNWLDADLADWPSYEWGPEGSPTGKPIRYVEGKGLEIEGGQ